MQILLRCGDRIFDSILSFYAKIFSIWLVALYTFAKKQFHNILRHCYKKVMVAKSMETLFPYKTILCDLSNEREFCKE